MAENVTNEAEVLKGQKFGLKRLVGLARPHWRPLSLATIALVLGSGISLLYPQAARLLVDEVFVEGSEWDLSTIGFGLLGLFLVQSIFVSVRYYLFTVIGDRVVADLRQRLFRAIVVRDMGFFDATKTGELTSRLTSDTQILQSAVTTNLSMALRYGMQAIGGIVVCFVTSVKLSLVILVLLPVVFSVAIVYGRRVRKLSREVQDAVADSTSLAEEALSGIRTVRSFAREEHESARYDGAIERSFDLAKTRSMLGSVFSGGMSFLGYATIAVILWLGSMMVMNGEMTGGELTAYILYVLFVAFSLGVMSGLWTDFAKAIGSGERVFALIDAGEVDAEGAGEWDAAARVTEGGVAFANVSFSYPTRPGETVLRDISFVVKPGDRLALVGPSGSGKSTIASLLSRFYEPDSGEIKIDGRSIRSYEPNALRRQIGLVAQEPILFSGTIEENVMYGDESASREEVVEALRSANAWDFVQGFPDGIDTIVGERGVRLSGGQKQRIAIARALLKDPRLLILDEATSALDVESESLVQKALERLMEGRTTVVIAHRLSTIASADQVLVIDGGQIVEQGTHDELMARRASYFRMVELQLVAS